MKVLDFILLFGTFMNTPICFVWTKTTTNISFLIVKWRRETRLGDWTLKDWKTNQLIQRSKQYNL